MKVMCVLGSPRKEGNTARVLGWVEDDLRAAGHQIDRANITDYEVAGCLACRSCRKGRSDVPNCAQQDDANALFERMMEADAIVLAAPLFCWGFPAQIKPLIDRSICLVTGYGSAEHKSLIEGRRFALVMTAAGPLEKNGELAVEAFRRVARLVKCPAAGELFVPFCTSPDQLGDDVRSQARNLARDIAA